MLVFDKTMKTPREWLFRLITGPREFPSHALNLMKRLFLIFPIKNIWTPSWLGSTQTTEASTSLITSNSGMLERGVHHRQDRGNAFGKGRFEP
jgi:hypothetical protein